MIEAYWKERRQAQPRDPEDARDDIQRDYARVIHSASFRRLQGKTQILSLGDGDFYRTRLTHSLEVAQIASGIVQVLDGQNALPESAAEWLPGLEMIQAIGLTHDLGHPPFGHGGEVALNYCMRDHGGFEGNGQTLRILSKLEKFSENDGANLTRRTLLGVLKYPVAYSEAANPGLRPRLAESSTTLRLIDRDACTPPKCYLDSEREVVDWLLAPLEGADRTSFQQSIERPEKHRKPSHKSLDCSIMDLADDIAFGVHDLEDAIALELFDEAAFRAHVSPDDCRALIESSAAGGTRTYEQLVDSLFAGGATRKSVVGELVRHLLAGARVKVEEPFRAPLLRYRVVLDPDRKPLLDALQTAVRHEVIKSAPVQQLEFKGQTMVIAVFEALATDPMRLLPGTTRIRFDQADVADRMRVLCDHIAGMTDGFLIRTYERLFSPRVGSVFDRL